jgi:hypothetical protein
MPITPNFTATQSSGTPSTFTLTDTSTGTDVTITKRRIYLLKADGTYLVPAGTTTSYIEWSITNVNTRAPLTIDLDVLTQDTALWITVQWLNVSNTLVESKVTSFAFTAYNESFYYGLSEQQVANQALAASTDWYENKMKLRVELDSAQQAIQFASDIYTAQSALNRATYFSNNSNFFF